MGSLVLVTTIFCVIVNPFTALVALLVVGQFGGGLPWWMDFLVSL